MRWLLVGLLLLTPLTAGAQEVAEDVIARARALLRDDDVSAADEALTYGLTQWPEHHDLLVLAGWTATWTGRAPLGVRLFARAREQAPDSLDAWDGLAYAYAAMGSLRKSREALERAQALDGNEETRNERALRIRWVSGDIAGSQVEARRLEKTQGASEITEAITVTPLGFAGRVYSSIAFRQEAPLARIGGEVRIQPHGLLRVSLFHELSTWLGDREVQLGGAVQLRTPKGFSFVLHGAGGVPGLREARGTVGVGFGWRFLKLVEMETGWTFRAWGGGTTLHMIRLGALLDLASGTDIGAGFVFGLVRPAADGLVRVVPGGRITVSQLVWDPISIEGGYSIGTEVIVHPVTFSESTLLTHELRLGMRVELTARLGFSAGYMLQAWSGRAPFHGMNGEFRALW